jgi:hypothetical protein
VHVAVHLTAKDEGRLRGNPIHVDAAGFVAGTRQAPGTT